MAAKHSSAYGAAFAFAAALIIAFLWSVVRVIPDSSICAARRFTAESLLQLLSANTQASAESGGANSSMSSSAVSSSSSIAQPCSTDSYTHGAAKPSKTRIASPTSSLRNNSRHVSRSLAFPDVGFACSATSTDSASGPASCPRRRALSTTPRASFTAASNMETVSVPCRRLRDATQWVTSRATWLSVSFSPSAVNASIHSSLDSGVASSSIASMRSSTLGIPFSGSTNTPRGSATPSACCFSTTSMSNGSRSVFTPCVATRTAFLLDGPLARLAILRFRFWVLEVPVAAAAAVAALPSRAPPAALQKRRCDDRDPRVRHAAGEPSRGCIAPRALPMKYRYCS
eukprot:Rhum_TRINITY_DN13966_c4_g1::Rhum_TRINITY_DN13966_c4_g1_i1::g.66582::m.66582